MVDPVQFQTTADRWIRLRTAAGSDDPPFELDEAGFLLGPRENGSAWVRPADAAEAGAWVLLGEPGAGKTTAFRQLLPKGEEAQEPLPGDGGTVWLTGADLPDRDAANERLGAHLDALPSKSDLVGNSDQGSLLVVLDQLDESAFLPNFAVWLHQRLRGRDTTSLRVWIACRTADFSDQLSIVLERVFGRYVLGDLAPLTRAEAVKLVASAGFDGEAFLHEIVGHGAASFAAIPLTLKVLLDAYKQDPRSLGDGPEALFSRGVAALASEPDQARRLRGRADTTVEQRLAIASRVAAHLLLSGRRWVHSYVLEDVADEALPLGAVVGGEENAGAGAFSVTKAMVEETLSTALFTRTGPARVAFAHSSFAAYLAARHLSASLAGPAPIPKRQLEMFLLVSAVDEDTAAIPAHLRELAAWMLAQAPTQLKWLAAADPESIVPHSAIVTAPEARATIVEGLLDRADRIELVDRAWQHTRWNLRHPGLGQQLGKALDAAIEDPVVDWPAHARARLAWRLASDSGIPELADPLLRWVERDDLPVYLRQRAARGALALDSSESVISRLRTVLAALSQDGVPPAEVVDADSPVELVGSLLRLLWPEHLTFAEAVIHINPLSHGIIGVYHAQMIIFPDDVRDEDLAELVGFTEEMLRQQGVVVEGTDRDASYEYVDDMTVSALGRRGLLEPDRVRRMRRFVLRVADRVLHSPVGGPQIGRVARMVLWFLSSSEFVELPGALNVVREDDACEPEDVRALRREFAEALLQAARQTASSDRTYWVYRVLAAWSEPSLISDYRIPSGIRRGDRRQLLDNGDVDWAVARGRSHRDTDSIMADVFEIVATTLSHEPEDEVDVDLSPTWELAEEFAAAQRSRLDAAESGDATAFWMLVKYLNVAPATGSPEPIMRSRATDFAGAVLWPREELSERMRVSAAHYLASEQDHYEQWLGLDRIDWRAYAGHVALSEIQRHEDIPPDRWKCWVGTVLNHAPAFEHNVDQVHDALELVGRHASVELGKALAQYVRTRVAYSEVPTRLPRLPSSLTSVVRELVVEMDAALRVVDLTELAVADPEIVAEGPIDIRARKPERRVALATDWADLLRQPLSAGDTDVVRLVEDAIRTRSRYADAELGQLVAVLSAHELLVADPVHHWPLVRDQVGASPEFSHLLAEKCSSEETTPMITVALSEQDLADVYRWLASVRPSDPEDLDTMSNVDIMELDIGRWRHNVATQLSRHESPEAVRALRRLSQEYPDGLDLHAALLDARRAVQAKQAVRLRPADVTSLLNDHSRRVVRSAHQLATVVLEVLDAIAADLHTHSNLLWDCERGDRPVDAPPRSPFPLEWRPKAEGALGAYLAHELDLRLAMRRVVVNREVMIRPTDHGDSGQRPDIKIDVVSPDSGGDQPGVMTIPIEIKGAWHSKVLEAQADQLAGGYVLDTGTTDGIYLVAWYSLEDWTTTSKVDSRRRKAARHKSGEQLGAKLAEQAKTIRATTGLQTHPYVLTVRRAVPTR